MDPRSCSSQPRVVPSGCSRNRLEAQSISTSATSPSDGIAGERT